MNTDDYQLLDSGNGRKLERFGRYVLARPASQAIWRPQLSTDAWDKAHAYFSRDEDNRWYNRHNLPDTWQITVEGVRFQLKPTDFGHLGVFPEQRFTWRWLQETIADLKKDQDEVHVLNLFAYSGGASLAAARGGANVCHLDASQGMVQWAGENAKLNGLEKAPIRWIVDDASKFLAREIRRGRRYDGIILDPPTFGRGNRGELFKIEEHLVPLLQNCRELLVDPPKFVLLSCHTPGITPICLTHLLKGMMDGIDGDVTSGEMVLEGKCLPLPSGSYAHWHTKS
ncbi:MAG: class I SAM-dependent methyltransferase [Chlamydiales bacterium]|nr:class I SAM-dependent methyltransferase [Chlamydiales bacterium]